MNLSTEAKVGAVSLIGLLLLVLMVAQLGGYTFGEKGYAIQAVFSQVGGLKQGNIVRYAGVDIGKVEDVRASEKGVEVLLRIKPGVKIPVGAKFSIGTDGLLGEKFVNIAPPPASKDGDDRYIKAGATVQGESPAGIDQLVGNADKVLADLHRLVNSLNDIFYDDKVRASLKETALNAREITASLNEFSAALARMALYNEQDVNAMVGNLKVMSDSLRSVAARVDGLVANVDNNGQTASDLRETLKNLKTTSERVEKMAAALEGVATDPETAQNIRETLRNARSASEKANKLMTKIDGIRTETSFETMYNSQTGRYRSDIDLRVNTSARDFAVIGVTDIGEGNRANFQVGRGDGDLSGRLGLIEGKAGLGADLKLSNQLRLSLDVYDPNDVRVKLRSQYQLSPQTFLVGETDSLNKQSEQRTYFGLRRTF